MSIGDGNVALKDISSATMIQYVEQNDLHLVVPKANELFLDLDNQGAIDRFNGNYRLLSGVLKDLRFLSMYAAPSRNKPQGQHITIQVSRNLTNVERIALQAVLGSDLVRELYSLAQYFEGEPLPTVFFEAKPQQITDKGGH